MPHAFTSDGNVDWDREAELAVLDLLGEKHAVPWPEAISRISNSQWKDFWQGATASARRSAHSPHEQTCRPPRARRTRGNGSLPSCGDFPLSHPTISQTEFETERGRRRGMYRSFLSWTGDSVSCGHHAERVLITSMRRAAGDGILTIPQQRRGQVSRVRGNRIERGPLDALGFLPNLPHASSSVPFLVEVKNVSDWIYAWDQRLWELLVKAAEIGQHEPVLPLLACPYSDITAAREASDIGFLRIQYQEQLFTDDPEKIPSDRFSEVVAEFGLVASQWPEDQPHPTMVEFFANVPRRRVRGRQGRWTEWYKLLSERFFRLSPLILDFDALAGPLEPATRSHVHRAFFEAARGVADWNFQGGWARSA